MLLELKSIQKSFGGVAALRDGNLAVDGGEVHLLMGENGAGKSTMMKIVAGLLQRDGGEMLWRGRPVRFRNPAEAARERHRDGASGIAAGSASDGGREHVSGARGAAAVGVGEAAGDFGEGGADHRGARLSVACGMAGGKAESGGQADGGDLPGDSAGIEPADFRRADFVVVGQRRPRRSSASCARCANATWG